MATYTNLGIKKITTGDESGTWGTSTNTNFDYFDTAIVGYVAVTLPSAGSSGTPNTINVADFSVSDGRNRVIEFVDAGDLGGTAYVQITPNDFEGYYFIQNSLSGSRSILLFQGTYDAGRDYEIPSGKDVVVRCTGSGTTSYIYNVLDNLQVNSLKASLSESTGLPVSTGISGLGTGVATALAVNTGSAGAVVVNGGALGTPSSGTLTNAIGLPVSTGISGLGTGVATFLATPSSANLAAAVTNETGSGSLVFATSPTLLNVAVGLTSGTSAIIVGGTESATGGNPRNSFYDLMTLSSGATVSHSSFYSYPQTVAATFTLPNHYSFYAEGIAVNTGVTVTNQYSVYINSSANAATNNYGVYSNIASSANRWNFYAAGTAPNYFAGTTTLAGTVNLSGLTASTALALDASKNIVSITNTGSGNNVLATSPVLTTPNLGTPSNVTLTNATGLPVATGISGLGTGVATFLATPSSANLAAAVTNETGSGSLVFATSPSLTNLTVAFSSSNNSAINVNSDPGNAGTNRTSFLDSVTVSSSAPSQQTSFYSLPYTTDAVFTLPVFYGFRAEGIFRLDSTTAGATITNQYAFFVNSSNTAATTNYGFYSNIAASGTSRYNFYAAGTAPNYFGGSTVISVTDNTNAALRVTQLGTANALEIEDSANVDATPFIVNSSGNLIQGYTTTVASKILTTPVTPAWQTHNVQLGVYSWTNNASLPGFLVFNKSKSGTVGTISAVTDGDNLGIIQFNGADNDTTSTFSPSAYIFAQVAGTVAPASVPARLNFSTTSVGGAGPVLRVSITPEGYVGIGATPASAQQLLDLRGTNNGLTSDTAVNTLRFSDTDTTTAANQPIGKIEFASSDLDNAAVGAYILASSVGTAGGGTIRFGAAANAGAVAEVARVASTGLTVTLDTAGLGYGTGTGGTVTQATSRTTGVTLNKTNGSITLVSAAGTATWQSFTVTNSTVAISDVVVLSQRSGTDLYMLEVTAVAAGSFRISFATTGGTTTEQPVFNFAVIKAVTA